MAISPNNHIPLQLRDFCSLYSFNIKIRTSHLLCISCRNLQSITDDPSSMRCNLGLLHFTFLFRAEGSTTSDIFHLLHHTTQKRQAEIMASRFDDFKIDKISFDGDSRVQWRKANLNGRNYGTLNLLSYNVSPTPSYINTDFDVVVKHIYTVNPHLENGRLLSSWYVFCIQMARKDETDMSI